MGLFDFLKSKPQPTDAPQKAAPNTDAPAPDAAPAEPTGPRYKGSNYSLPPQPGPVPPPQQPLVPPMPPVPPFEPVNQLEQVLLQAATTPEARPLFYRALLQEEVLVVLHPREGLATGEVAPTEGMEIQLQVLNDGKIPVFTSLERIGEGSVDLATLSYLRLRGLDLFQMVQGADCALNPFSPVGKLLPAPELAELLAGNLTGPLEGSGPPQDVQVTLAPLGDAYPELAEALRTYGPGNANLEAAYLAQMQIQGSPEAPRLLLALHAADNDPAFLEELGPIVQGLVGDQQVLDIMLIDPTSDEPINQYFQQAEPVYRKQAGS